jgi:hypothetical protein
MELGVSLCRDFEGRRDINGFRLFTKKIFREGLEAFAPSWAVFLHAVGFPSSNRSGRSFSLDGKTVMHAVMRDYSGNGAKKFFELLESKKAEVKDVLMPIKGFVSYSLVRTARGGFSVTICQDKTGTDESVRVAREWIAKNAGDAGAAEPTVLEGTVILHL